MFRGYGMACKRILTAAAAITFLALLMLLYNASAENAGLKREVQECMMRWRNLHDDYIALEDAYAQIRLQLENLTQTHAEIQFQLANLTQAYDGLRRKHVLLREDYAGLNSSYRKLMVEYEDSLKAYSSLKTEYAALMQNYSLLKSEHAKLSEAYFELENRFERLQATLENFSSSYTMLRSVLYEPLTNKTVPMIEELKEWLAEDDVDKIKYRYPEFVCGDYAVMLAFRAKLKGWDMGVVVVLGYYPDRREFNHAFNAIKCREGLVYVEPQKDSVWWNPGYGEIKSGGWYTFPDFGRIYIDKVIVVVLY